MQTESIKTLAKQYSFVPFAVVGLVNTLIDLLVLNLLLHLGINTYLSVALGFFAGLTNGYFMNTYFVFQTEKSTQRYLKYFIVSMIGLLLTELIVYLLHGLSGLMSALGAKLVAVVLVFFWNYLLSKKWAFK